jgi:hypothetical protein
MRMQPREDNHVPRHQCGDRDTGGGGDRRTPPSGRRDQCVDTERGQNRQERDHEGKVAHARKPGSARDHLHRDRERRHDGDQRHLGPCARRHRWMRQPRQGDRDKRDRCSGQHRQRQFDRQVDRQVPARHVVHRIDHAVEQIADRIGELGERKNRLHRVERFERRPRRRLRS